MKKLVTWISKVGDKLKSTTSLGRRSARDRRPTQPDKVRANSSTTKPSTGSLSTDKKATAEQNSTANSHSGVIGNLNHKYLKLPEPFARFLKPIIITVALVIAYAVLGFYVLPFVLKAKLPNIIYEKTGRNASVDNIEFNPFKLYASIQGFKILEKNGKPFVTLDQFYADINAFKSIRYLALVFDEINLKKPTVQLAKLKNGKFNFEDMKKAKEEPKKDDTLFPFKILNLSLTEGKLVWTDNHFAKPVSEVIFPINLTLTDLRTEAASKGKLDLNLALKSGGKLDLQSSVGVNPVFSEGQIKMNNIQIQTLSTLVFSDKTAFDLKGHGLITVDYKVSTDNNLKVTIKKGKVELRDFQFADKSATKTLVKTPMLTTETDGIITVVNNNLDVAIKKAKFNSRDLQFSKQMADQKMAVMISAFNHETDIKVTQTKEGLKVVANKAKVTVKNARFIGLKEDKVEAKLPELALETAYQLGLLKKDKNLNLTLSQGKIDLRGLEMSEQGETKTLVKIPIFGLDGMKLNLQNRDVAIDSVVGRDAEFEAWLNEKGIFNYHALLVQKTKAMEENIDSATAKTVDFIEDTTGKSVNQPAASAKPNKDWIIKINNLLLQNFGLTFEDQSLNKPVVIVAKPINLKVNNLINKPDAKAPFQLDIGVNKTGSINLEGNAVISPPAATAAVTAKNIDLETFQPYVNKFARVDVLDGQFNLNGKLAAKQPPKQPLDVKFTGNTSVANLLTRDQLQNKDFIKWENLTFKDLDVDLLANSYSAATLLIEKPYAKVTIRKDKTVNFSDIIIADQEKDDNPAKPARATKVRQSQTAQRGRPIFKLAKVKIVDGSSDFADLSLILPFAAQIKSLDGGAAGISSERKSTINVALKGNAYDLAPVDVKGEISPYLGNFDVDLNFYGLPMPLVTPYMVQFAGYKVEKGKLTMGLKYQVQKGQLKAANKIVIDQLELGEKVENPNAVSLPFKLAVALLKDSSGKIKLDVPLTGSLEDPKFDMGKLIVDALVNVLTKIVTSPFNAIASLVGSEQNLSVIAFAPGKNTLAAKEMNKLDDVATALKKKPILNLEVKGAAYEEQDWPILREQALLDQLKKAKAAELSEDKGRKIRAEYVELSEDDYNDMLADAFIKRYPELGEKSFFGTPKLINSDDDFYSVAKQKLSQTIKPEPDRLNNLASERAQAIAKYIVQKGGIANDRVYILDPAVNPKREGKAVVSALSLKAN